MNCFCQILLSLAILVLSGCAGATPISHLALPPVSAIEGTVTEINEVGFTLTDNSGSIYVRTKVPDNKKVNISNGEKVKIYGNLLSGKERVFDSYVIKNSTGEQIILTNPSPHFGFILQTSFQ